MSAKLCRKRFRAEGDFLVSALVDLVAQCRSQIGRLESEFAEFEKLACEKGVATRRSSSNTSARQLGLSEVQLRKRLNQLQELHILPEHRVQPDPDYEGEAEPPG